MLTLAQARTAITRDWGLVLSALAALDEPGWALPTRCAGWTLLDLARHATWGTSMEADAIARARAGTPGPAQGVELAGGGPAETLAGLRWATRALDAELARAAELGPDADLAIPFGVIPAAFAWDVFTMEAGIHADDVAAAVGVATDLPHDVVAATTAVLAVVLPALAAGGESPPPGTAVALHGSTVSLGFVSGADGGWLETDTDTGTDTAADTVTGDDTGVLRFALGRASADDPRLTVSTGARAFKRWFPGP